MNGRMDVHTWECMEARPEEKRRMGGQTDGGGQENLCVCGGEGDTVR